MIVQSLLVIFALICAFLLLQGMLRRGAIYQYPFLVGAVFTGFVLPQLIGLSRDPFLPPGGLEKTLIMTILCAAMCWVGTRVVRRPWRAFDWKFDERKLLLVSAMLSLFGAYFYYAITRLPPELTEVSMWTGLPVAYLFFARMMTYGFAIAVLLFAHNRSRLALMVALFGAAFYFDRIAIAGRRAELIEFATIILLAAWFQRKRCLPRPVMLTGLIVGALFINSTGEYRAATLSEEGPQWDRVADIDFVGNIKRLTEEGGSELRNAVYIISAVDRNMDFDLGAFQWNRLVFAFVPRQIVGADIKSDLYLPLGDAALQEYQYTPPAGSTVTGLSDAFQSFWYFGCLEFLLIAVVMQKLWLAARNGSITAQLLYMLLPVQAMQAVTHYTNNFLLPWPHMAVFLLPALLLARQGRRSASHSIAGYAALPAVPQESQA